MSKKGKEKEAERRYLYRCSNNFFQTLFPRKKKKNNYRTTIWNKLEKNSRSSKSLDRKLVTFVSSQKERDRVKNIKNQVTVFRNRFHPIRDYRFYSPFATISSVISSHGSHKSQREYYPPLALGGENHRVNAWKGKGIPVKFKCKTCN